MKKERKEPTFDPDDWAQFRAKAHEVLDMSIDRLEHAQDHPWQPVPSKLKQRFSREPAPSSGSPLADTIEEIKTGKKPEPVLEVRIDLPVCAFLPPEFIPREKKRLALYYQLSAMTNIKKINELFRKLIKEAGQN